MFPPPLSLSRLLPAVMLSCGTENLLTYNNSLEASGGSNCISDFEFRIADLISRRRVNSDIRRYISSTPMELIIILIFLPKRMNILAKERGRSGVAWTFAAIGALLGGEVLVMLTWLAIYTVGVIAWGWSPDVERQPATYVVYIIALLGGLTCADLVRRHLISKPIVRHDVKQWGGILS